MINKLVNLSEKILPIAIGIIGVVSREINTMLLSAIAIILFYIFIITSDFINKIESMEVIKHDNN
ncbi:hypothetical protein [Clostridium sp.]|uniref:hypothetical protein n=1 Tax=Clostridium sp. TaxID=1506 RepID=UPI001B43CD0A|nr:hypothetical protein [Clostridium sp.]MBP3707796.1 hypothetical protein [Clostridia bacterium]MBP3917019.1 hypothetical protein [Clostridium sp.]MBP3928575.1 hypothetical protein [Peptostreptococcaceae bacterium]